MQILFLDFTNENRYRSRPMNNKVERNAAEAHAATRSATKESGQPARISSLALLGNTGELVIEHAGREYRLRVTQNGKLILTA